MAVAIHGLLPIGPWEVVGFLNGLWNVLDLSKWPVAIRKSVVLLWPFVRNQSIPRIVWCRFFQHVSAFIGFSKFLRERKDKTFLLCLYLNYLCRSIYYHCNMDVSLLGIPLFAKVANLSSMHSVQNVSMPISSFLQSFSKHSMKTLMYQMNFLISFLAM